MTEQTKLEVSIPYTAIGGWLDERFRTPVRELLREHGGMKLSRYRKEPLCMFIQADFSDRGTAVNAAKAIRRLALEHATESANDFTYIVDNDELLLFNNKDDEDSFQSKSVTEEIQEWHERSLSESRDGTAGV